MSVDPVAIVREANQEEQEEHAAIELARRLVKNPLHLRVRDLGHQMAHLGAIISRKKHAIRKLRDRNRTLEVENVGLSAKVKELRLKIVKAIKISKETISNNDEEYEWSAK